MSEVYKVSIDTLVGNFNRTSNETSLRDNHDLDIDEMTDMLQQISDELKKHL